MEVTGAEESCIRDDLNGGIHVEEARTSAKCDLACKEGCHLKLLHLIGE